MLTRVIMFDLTRGESTHHSVRCVRTFQKVRSVFSSYVELREPTSFMQINFQLWKCSRVCKLCQLTWHSISGDTAVRDMIPSPQENDVIVFLFLHTTSLRRYEIGVPEPY